MEIEFSFDSADINRAIAKLQKFGDVVARNRQRIAALGGAFAASAAESAAPRSAKPHKRYSTPKASNRQRAPKGYGRVVAIYYPGNLRNSIRVLTFSRDRTKVWIGAKLAKGSSPKGTFGAGQRSDGYYLHMVERGTKYADKKPFFTRSIMASAPRVFRVMLNAWEKITNQFIQQNTVTP